MSESEFIRLYSAQYDDGPGKPIREELLVGVYAAPIPGEYEYDRIQLILTPEGQLPRGWIMTPSEARQIISGLHMAIVKAEAEGWDDVAKERT